MNLYKNLMTVLMTVLILLTGANVLLFLGDRFMKNSSSVNRQSISEEAKLACLIEGIDHFVYEEWQHFVEEKVRHNEPLTKLDRQIMLDRLKFWVNEKAKLIERFKALGAPVETLKMYGPRDIEALVSQWEKAAKQ